MVVRQTQEITLKAHLCSTLDLDTDGALCVHFDQISGGLMEACVDGYETQQHHGKPTRAAKCNEEEYCRKIAELFEDGLSELVGSYRCYDDVTSFLTKTLSISPLPSSCLLLKLFFGVTGDVLHPSQHKAGMEA